MVRVSWLVPLALLAIACQQQQPQEQQGSPAAAEQPAAEPAPQPGTPEWKVQNALSAAPPEIAAGAAVMDWPATEGGAMAELRKGTNGWTCLPDVPSTPGSDPMCLDPVFMNWAGAWQSKRKPTIASVRIGYMLMGGTDASNTDPYATQPKSQEDWVKSGPHIMVVVPDPAALRGLGTDPHSGGPWVMWQGTPYAHVMVPLVAPKSM